MYCAAVVLPGWKTLHFIDANEVSSYFCCWTFVEVWQVSGLWIQALLFYYALIYIWATLILNYEFVLFLFHCISCDGISRFLLYLSVWIVPPNETNEFPVEYSSTNCNVDYSLDSLITWIFVECLPMIWVLCLLFIIFNIVVFRLWLINKTAFYVTAFQLSIFD